MFDSLLYFTLLQSIDQESFQESQLSQFNFYFENDFFYSTDKYYTNSVKLEWLAYNKNIIYNFGIVQDMYTPSCHEIDFVKYGDHPYTGRFEGNFGVSVIGEGSMVSLDIGIGYTGEYTMPKRLWNLFIVFCPLILFLGVGSIRLLHASWAEFR